MEGCRTEAILIITHPNPDLDAMGFVYSAQKVFGSTVPVVFRSPTEQDLKDLQVIVGDVSAPQYRELGNRPDLNNFDHHYGCAEHSATFLFNQKFRVLRDDIVKYIDASDLRGKVEEECESCLKVIVAGIRLSFEGMDQRIVEEGGKLLEWLERTGEKPSCISKGLPVEHLEHLSKGKDEILRIRKEVKAMEKHRTQKGRFLGYVRTRSPVFSMVREEAFSHNVDLVLIHNTERRRYLIASNTLRTQFVNLMREGLIAALNWAEGETSGVRQRWGGHEDRIGSPRPSGSSLSAEQVLKIIKESM
ncbi:MAG: hypothetical protein ACUVQY_11465 [Thermoproteota archaeon]